MKTQNVDQSEILCVFDSKGKLILANDEFQNLLGYQDIGSQGLYAYDFVKSEFERELKAKLELACQKNEAQNFEMELQTKSGKAVHSEWELMKGEQNIYAFIYLNSEVHL